MSVKISATWAKKGQTPSIKEGCRYQHLSAISAISPDGKLYYQIQESTYKGIDIVDFLKNLLTFFDKDLLIIWDGAKIHSDENVRKFLENDNNNRIFLAKIPPYSPELNADEQVWQYLKNDVLKNVVCKNLTELEVKLTNAFEQLKVQKQRIASFIKHPIVGFYKS